MNKQILYSILVVLLFLGNVNIQAQSLEEVNLRSTGTCNTYLTGINNRGFVSGYYDSSGILTGFVINPNGKIKRWPGTVIDGIQIQSINDNNVCVAQVITGGNGVAYKAYYDTLTETFTNLAQIAGVGYNNVNVMDINDNNDVAGWYPNLSERWLWHNSDSVNINYDARRHNNAGFQPTYGGGINNNGIIGSFFINGGNYEPLFFDMNTNTFTPITGGTNKMKVWDVNNNNVIVGEYQVGGYWIGYWAQTVGNNITVVHPLTPIFEVNTPTIQSVLNGINDNFEMVGSYLDPVTNTWIGFIYRPFINEYRFPGFDWQQHTWSMQNTNTGANAVWTSAFHGNFNYTSNDPFKTSIPLITPIIQAVNPQLQTPNVNSVCADWKSFAEEIDSLDIENEAGNVGFMKYMTWKPLNVSRWCNSTGYFKTTFPGICYGFAFTSLLKATGHEDVLDTWFGLQQGVDLNTYTNTNSVAIRAITRTYLKQFDKKRLTPFATDKTYVINPWSGMFRLKNTFQDPVATRRNPRPIYIYLNGNPGGYHSILPYKITTPKKFPFYYNSTSTTDTVWVYDSNFPNDSTQYFLVNSQFYNNGNQSTSNTSYPNLQAIIFNEAGVKEMLPVDHSYLKSTSSSLEDPTVNVAINPNLYYTISGNGSTFATYNSGGHTNDIPYLTGVTRKDTTGPKPAYYIMDTSGTINVTSTNYLENRMEWNMIGSYRSMGINRVAQLNESDNGTWHNHIMTYGTHDNVTKELTGYLIETNADYTQGVNIVVQNISMDQGDSILTENPEQYVYRITRFASSSDTYDIWMDVTGVDSIQTFHFPGVVIEGNSSHTITPYFNGTLGTEVGVIVDNGLDGSVDDTLFIFSTSLNNVIHNVDYIRAYPNPMQKFLSVEVNADKDLVCNMILMDITGKIVLRQSKIFKTGKTVYNIETDGLSAGTYLLNIADEKGKDLFRQKMLK